MDMFEVIGGNDFMCDFQDNSVVVLGGGFFQNIPHSPLPPPLPFSLRLNLPGLSTSMQIWNVNDHPEGQTKKVNHFHAMLNMQILLQIKAGRHAIKLAS